MINSKKLLAWRMAAAAGFCLLQAGCTAFFQRELEALLAPTVPGNAVYVLDSVFYNFLAPFFY